MDDSDGGGAIGDSAPSGGEAGLFPLAVTRPPGSSREIAFGFGKPSPALAAQLARASLFFVIADPRPIGEPVESADPSRATFGNTLWLGGWPARALIGSNPAGAVAEGSILIVKYCFGTLEDLVGSPIAWADPKTFSTDGSSDGERSVEKHVKAAVADAIARGDSGDSLYQPFAAIARNPQWMGFLVLDSAVGAQGLPAPLAMLANDPGTAALRFPYLWGGRREPLYPDLGGIIDYAAKDEPGAPEPSGLSLRRLRTRFDHNYSSVFEAEATLSFGGTAPPLSLALTREGQAGYALSPAAPGEAYRLDSDGEPPLPLETWLERLLAGLWPLQAKDPAAPSLSVTIQVAWRSSLAGGLSTQVPVLMTGFIPREARADRQAKALGSGIRSWIEANRPSTNGAELVFEASFGSTPPDLRLEMPTIALALSAIRDSSGEAVG